MQALPSAAAAIDVATIRRALNDVLDPEMPIGIGDLGMIDSVEVEHGRARVTLLPTFTGCPAVEIVRSGVQARVRALGFTDVDVTWTFAHAWTPDRVSPAGVEALRAHGISPGARRTSESATTARSCPYCGSADVQRVSAFGGSLCRATYRCSTCRDIFESLKPSGIDVASGVISLL